MFDGFARAMRFGKAWKLGAPHLREVELELPRSGTAFPATLLMPDAFSDPLPAWVTLHGITRPGRTHPTLVRFVRALAAAGYAVLVPEVPEWREMRLVPKEAADTLRTAALTLAHREETAEGRVGVMGFSFGGPQALMAGTDPALRPHLKAVASFGGYCDIEKTLRFLFTGEHEWEGVRYRADPDPYGRWVAGGNYLSSAPGYEGTEDVAAALLLLAREAGDLNVASWDPYHDTRKKELEESLPPAKREIFRAFAPVHGEAIPTELVDALVPALARAARQDSPLFDIGALLGDITVPVRLIHGRQDRLIPFTETLRLAGRFPSGSDVRVFLTDLFSHSQRHGGRLKIRDLAEQLRFLNLISVVFGTL
jgi:pimeloyl-ACP methyl ester carboxylesterase